MKVYTGFKTIGSIQQAQDSPSVIMVGRVHRIQLITLLTGVNRPISASVHSTLAGVNTTVIQPFLGLQYDSHSTIRRITNINKLELLQR